MHLHKETNRRTPNSEYTPTQIYIQEKWGNYDKSYPKTYIYIYRDTQMYLYIYIKSYTNKYINPDTYAYINKHKHKKHTITYIQTYTHSYK